MTTDENGQVRLEVTCALIENGGGRLLAAKRPEGKRLAGLWEFPGGKLDRGETAEQGLKRELREELDIEVDIHRRLETVEYTYPWGTVNLIPFICSIKNGSSPRALEHSALRWADPAEEDPALWTPADLPVTREYLDLVKNNAGH